MLGPMTNLAMAVRLDPSIAKKVKKLVFMGGTSKGKGNISPCAEFNFFADPEAAHIVLESFQVSSINISSLLPLSLTFISLGYSYMDDKLGIDGRILIRMGVV